MAVAKSAPLSAPLESPASGCAKVQPKKPYTSMYRNATVFRDRNRNGRLDAGEPSTTTDADGGFCKLNVNGRLALEGGSNVVTGQPNTLRLTAPGQAKAISTFTSLWLTFQDRSVAPQKIKRLLGISQNLTISDVEVAPSGPVGNANTQVAAAPSASYDTLVAFSAFNASTPGASSRTAHRVFSRLKAMPAALPESGDPVILAVADALLGLHKKKANLRDQATVQKVLTAVFQKLGFDFTDQELGVVSQVVSQINGEIHKQIATHPGKRGQFAIIADQAANAFADLDFATLLARYAKKGGSLHQQATGRYLAFESAINTLVPGDTNGATDIFLYDSQTGVTTRISVASDGSQGNNNSYGPSISSDGHLMTFTSDASNLVPDDTNNKQDVFLHDTQTGTTVRLSVANDGAQGNKGSHDSVISLDGHYVVFESDASNLVPGDTNGMADIFLRDLQAGAITRISVASDNGQANGASHLPSITTDGHYVAFFSSAKNLVPGDTNGWSDIFLRDNQTGGITRISVGIQASEANGDSFQPFITVDGRNVIFLSRASNLVADDTTETTDVFLFDTQTETTTRIFISSAHMGNDQSSAPAISADGRYVAFQSFASNLVPGDTNNHPDVFLRDTQTRATIAVSVASDGSQSNDLSRHVAISADGQSVAFESLASNLVPGDTNDRIDVFLHTQSGATSRVSVASDGSQANGHASHPSMSKDGRYVAFESWSTNLAPGADAQRDVRDIFVHDTQTGTTTNVSVDSNGNLGQGNHESLADYHTLSMNGDGRYVAFTSDATDLVAGDTNRAADIFLHDTQTGTTTRISVASDGSQSNGDSYHPFISTDGRYVAFESWASNLAPGDTNGTWDVFLHDMHTGTTTRVSVASDGSQTNASSASVNASSASVPNNDLSVSADGRYVAFTSWASNLVPGDTNNHADVFLHDTQTGATIRVSVASDGREGSDDSIRPSLSGDGRYVAFESQAHNLVPSIGTLFSNQIFLHDTLSGVTTLISAPSGN